MSNFLRFWFPVILYSGMIFFMSSLSSTDIPAQVSYCDKFVHILEFMPFGFLFVRALSNTISLKSYKYMFFWGILASLGYGILDEYHQSFVPGRFSGMDDVVADVIGGTVGIVVYCLLIQLRNKFDFQKGR